MAGRQTSGGQVFLPAMDKSYEDKSDLKLSDVDTNVAFAAPSLCKILQMNAQTSEEKFKVLDARDKLYKLMKDKDPSLKRGALIATCKDMCPEKERLLREYQGRGSIFEMTNFSKSSSFNHNLAVKEYARSSADQEEPLPHDLRPVHVLTMTMSHLLHNVVDYCELSDENLKDWYMFMWDRTRALRKELTQQGVYNLESVTLVEQCARFHIHCAERMIDQDSSIYDDKINTENLTKCLQTLKYMYKDLAKEDIKCPNEPEFICYSLLLNLNNSSVFTELSGMSNSLMTSEPVKFALNVMATWETKNYIRFFYLVRKTSYLNCCLLRRYFGEMRLYAVKTMIRSYCTRNYSPQILITRFVETLNFEREEECLNFLSYCHFNFHEVDGQTFVNFDRVLFKTPSSTAPSGRAFLFIEEKKQQPLSVIMAGGTMPPKLFETYVPHSSFTPDGDLDPDIPPQKELLDFYLSSGSYKSPPASLDLFPEREQTQTSRDPRLQKEETTWSSPSSSMFAFKEKSSQPTNIFKMNQTSFSSTPKSSNIFGNNANIGSFGNIFDSPVGDNSKKNIFGNQASSTLFGGIKSTGFSLEPKFPAPTFSSSIAQPENNNMASTNTTFKVADSFFGTGFQNNSIMSDSKLKEEREYKEKQEKEEEERRRIKEEEERRRKEEEEKARILLEKKRIEEENQRRELERREREKRENEDRRKKEELARLEREEQNRREEAARLEKLREANARHLEELKRQEENKRRIELEYKEKVDAKMLDLKKKIQIWKMKIVFDKWRVKTWARIEERKMKEYFKEVKVKYPPVCTEKELNGNPYGLLIPSILTFEKFRDWKKVERKPAKKLLIVNDKLPLIKVGSVLGKPLEDLAKNLGCKLDPFPWKLIISVPDSSESPDSWKNIETFVEMHFVEHFHWQFGVEKGPLYCRGGNHGSFRFNISVRRLRGSQLYEGNEPNVNATTGSNALLFFMSESGNQISCERLKAVLKSRPPLPKIPVVIIMINCNLAYESLKKLLDLESLEKSHITKFFVIPVFDNKQQPVVQLTRSLTLAAVSSSSPSSLRVNKFSTFFSGSWIESLWRRVEISLSNFKIIMREPKALIDFYNSCIEELSDIFLDKKLDEYTVLAQEFSECELPAQPFRTQVYEDRLKSLLDRLKLPHWPAETPKSCHQLNYRIHQYCKKVTGQNKAKIKNLKWVLYRIIKQSLSWKGLDIHCEENISEILTNFPWIQVFKEISGVLTRQICEEVKDGEELTIIHDLERVEKFSFESSFIGKFLNKSKRGRPKKSSLGESEEPEEMNPRLEEDSVVYAYSAAIERETFKRKREESLEEGLDDFFSSPAGKRIVLEEEEEEQQQQEQEQPEGVDFSTMEANFQDLDERLNAMEKRMNENLKMLMDIQKRISI